MTEHANTENPSLVHSTQSITSIYHPDHVHHARMARRATLINRRINFSAPRNRESTIESSIRISLAKN